MPVFVEIAVNVPQVMGVFHYHLPLALEGRVSEGCLVTVPFGSQSVYGIVLRSVSAPAVPQTRPVIDLVDDLPVLTAAQLDLAAWMAEQTLTPLAECIAAMLPPGLYQQADTLYDLRGPLDEAALSDLSPLQVKLVKLLQKRGALRGRQIDASLPRQNWQPAARWLVRKGVIASRSVLPPPRVSPKTVRTARLACLPSVARAALPSLGDPDRWVRATCDLQQAQVLRPQLARTGTAAGRRWEMLQFLLTMGEAVPLGDLYRVPQGKASGNAADVERLVQLELAEVIELPSPVMQRRQSILDFLIREPGDIDVTWLYAASGGNLADLYFLEECGLLILGETEIFRDPLADIEYVLAQPPLLTREQQAAWSVVHQELRKAQSSRDSSSARASAVRPILLHGVTGSGKTEIYLRAVEQVLAQGRQAIILVPEIAITPQTVRRFINRFPGQVGLVHSGLSPGERYDTWRRARAAQLSIVVGPRSALFTPFPDLGLIVMDEFHDASYYQGDSRPHYHARDSAIAYARMVGAVILMGSATPDLVSYTRAAEDYTYIQLPNRILAHQEAVRAQMERLKPQLLDEFTPEVGATSPTRLARSAGTGIDDSAGRPAQNRSHYRHLEAQAESIDLPPVEVVDMRAELRYGNRSIFSRALQDSLAEVLHNQQQAIIFLNRRGSATYVFCRDCGFTVKCPRCDLPLTFHAHAAESFYNIPSGGQPAQPRQDSPAASRAASSNKATSLDCHHCGYSRRVPSKCPQCGSSSIRHFGTGTERVVEEVSKFFPEVRILRWDWETTRQKGSHEIILSHFTAHRADILVGTQMLAKGLDIPLVTLVGVVLADVGLSLPDYTANERTFQVLAQVAGRAGRSPLGGKVVLQTFQPEHFVIQTAANHDFSAFAGQELDYRRQLGYPPYADLLRLEVRDSDPAVAEQAALEMAEKVRVWMKEDNRKAIQLLGPYPPFFSRLGGLYRWHIILRGHDPVSLFQLEGRRGVLLSASQNWHIEVNPPSLL